MYIVKNAIKTITRNISRNVLLGIVITIIAAVSVVALSINNAATDIIRSKTENAEISVSFTQNKDAMRQNFQKEMNNGEEGGKIKSLTQSLSDEELANYVNSEYVKDVYEKCSIALNANEITKASNEDMFNKANESKFGTMRKPSDIGAGMQMLSGDFTLNGYNKLEALNEFILGTYSITNGEMLEDFENTTNEIVINEELASENELEVGSTINFTNPENEEEIFICTIVGLFKDNSINSDVTSMFSNSSNTIITTSKTIEGIVSNSSEEFKLKETSTPTIILNSFESVEPFKTELNSKGLSSAFEIVTNEEEILESIKPLENLKNFSNVFLFLIIFIGIFILVILNMINIRERKYEIGVLRAIGMKKHKVCMQFVLETSIIACTFAVIGLVFGAILSVPTANMMLENEIATIQEETENINQNMGGRGPMSNKMDMLQARNDVNYIENINASLNFVVVGQLLLIMVGITLVSSIMSIVTIIKYDPLKILSSRS